MISVRVYSVLVVEALALVLLLGVAAARCETVESLSDYRACCGRCAYERGCSDDPRDRGACCDPPEHDVPHERGHDHGERRHERWER